MRITAIGIVLLGPYCGEPLRTPRAKQCRHCRRDWHDPATVGRLGGA